MTIEEKVTEVINGFVGSNGTNIKMTPDQLFALVTEAYPINRNSFLPADYCYNRTNEGINFEKHVHLFERTEDGEYLILGEDYTYSGPVYCRKRGETEDSICGVWTNGAFKVNDSTEEITDLRVIDLLNGIRTALKAIPVTVNSFENTIEVKFQELLICGAEVGEEVYKIYNASPEWANKTSYQCNKANDGTWYYYLDSIDECIGEVQRLVMFEAQKKPYTEGNHTSELYQMLSAEVFENAYAHFIEQADKNTETKKAQGPKAPFGFSKKPEYDGAHLETHYGQGAASAAPYMNWWVVSIYYLPYEGKIVMGIEEDRYPHLKQMQIKPLRYDQIGNKKINVAVFYSAPKTYLNYKDLYEKFIDVCEEVMRLGLE
ncbi:MAG: hypothetical protein PUD22_06020 [Erysipelotrichaceae bacterium]|nr:hypothetical protein [Erysipelotrichaceae bacterium]